MMATGQELYRKAKRLIPGGTQLLSKRPEMFLPDQWPSYYHRAQGTHVWDLDGHRYVDMSTNGIGSCALGFADPDVNAAVTQAIADGTMATLNCPEEVELAELLCDLHPWAEMVRYARCGGESMAIAVRIARAATGRNRVAFCGYHGWQDWYLSANLAQEDALGGHLLTGLDPTGVPHGLSGTALPFHFNQLSELETIVSRYGDDIAAIVMEPMRDGPPQPGFMEAVRAIADRIGAVWILDEITAGFRLRLGGAHLDFAVQPDIAVFAKAMSNGFPMAAIIGRASVMEAAQRSFISSTYWTERIGPVAALATIDKHRRLRVAEHLAQIGTLVQDGWRQAAAETGLNLHVGGLPQLAHFTIAGNEGQAAKTLFTQLMLERGFLASSSFYPTYAHQPEHLDQYLAATCDVFATIATALCDGSLVSKLKGPIAHTGFQRLT